MAIGSIAADRNTTLYIWLHIHIKILFVGLFARGLDVQRPTPSLLALELATPSPRRASITPAYPIRTPFGMFLDCRTCQQITCRH